MAETPDVERATPTRRGRPPRFIDDPEIVQRLKRAYAVGAPLEFCATYAGIGVRTLDSWRKKAIRRPKSAYGRLFRELEQLEAAAAIGDLASIRSAEAWQAKAWRLERRYPQHFARRDPTTQVHVSVQTMVQQARAELQRAAIPHFAARVQAAAEERRALLESTTVDTDAPLDLVEEENLRGGK